MPIICNAIASSMITVSRKNQYKDLLTDFIIANKTTRKIAYISREPANVYRYRPNDFFNGELYTILTNKSRKERAIVAMVAGT
jgi:seryl-tRNA synthetase